MAAERQGLKQVGTNEAFGAGDKDFQNLKTSNVPAKRELLEPTKTLEPKQLRATRSSEPM
jgi:hypothetical protein